jgi:hypothetical protein
MSLQTYRPKRRLTTEVAGQQSRNQTRQKRLTEGREGHEAHPLQACFGGQVHHAERVALRSSRPSAKFQGLALSL